MTTYIKGTDNSAAAPAVTGTDGDTGLFFPAANTAAISTGGSERLRIDSSGNLGLGVTPSAWGGSFKSLELQGGSVTSSSGTNIRAVANAYYNGTNWVYKGNGAGAGRYEMFGDHAWYIAPSGTAGSAITFTQAMTLDASGNLGVGATSPTALTDIYDPASASSKDLLHVRDYLGGGSDKTRLIVKNGGNVGIGTSSPDSILTFAGNITSKSSDAYGIGTNGGNNHFNVFATGGSGAVRFFTGGSSATSTGGGGTERARIDSSGYARFTSVGGYIDISRKFHEFTASDNLEWLMWTRHTSTSSPYGIVVSYPSASPNGATNEFLNLVDSTTSRFIVRSNGGIANYSANNVNLSDLNVKKEFKTFKDSGYSANSWQFMKDMQDAWGRFKYKDQSHDDFNNGYGAQLVKVAADKNGFHELVDYSKWGSDKEVKDDDGNVIEVIEAPMRHQVYDNDLMHIVGEVVTQLTHKVDELKAELDSVKAELAVIKGA